MLIFSGVDLKKLHPEPLLSVACGRVDLGGDAKDSQLIFGSGIGRLRVFACFGLCRDAFASE